MEQLITRHVSGRLKVAPEHTSDATLRIMRKPSFKYFHAFKKKYDEISAKFGLKQPLIPYFISSHPGCEEEDMANLAAETKDLGFHLEQVQDFTPTPMTGCRGNLLFRRSSLHLAACKNGQNEGGEAKSKQILFLVQSRIQGLDS
jgi:radical SAM superfamily enzyme YgiQ (UPF0313 family)